MTDLIKDTKKKRISFCPYCGKVSLEDTGIKYPLKENKYCTSCHTHFEVQEDFGNDFGEDPA